MKKKLSITISEDLYEQVLKIKGGAKISHLIEEALDDFVLYKKSVKEYRNLGFKDGQKQSISFSHDEKAKFLEIVNGHSRYGRWSRTDIMDELFERFALKDTQIAKKHNDISDGKLVLNVNNRTETPGQYPEQAYEYLAGWLDGVIAVIDPATVDQLP